MRETPAAAPSSAPVPVSRLANFLRLKLDEDVRLQRIRVLGEITGWSPQANGNCYFDLKDRDATISCVAWNEAASGFPPLANGQSVIVTGRVGMFVKKSRYQITVFEIELEGAGALHARYEALKRRLTAEGLFDSQRKRRLPRYPFRVALVSSRSANGAGDFLAKAAQFAPHVRIDMFATSVQGDAAALEIARAIDRASAAAVDIVVLARGGGSYEDLFVFNHETVVRALARCAHPTVSAIGHEADTVLTDLVADLRVATPTDAARAILPRTAELSASVARCDAALARSMRRAVEIRRAAFASVSLRSAVDDPGRLMAPRRQRVDDAAIDLHAAVRDKLATARGALDPLERRLADASPAARIARQRERLVLARTALPRALQKALGRDRDRLTQLAGRLAPAVALGTSRRRHRGLEPAVARLEACNPRGRVARAAVGIAQLDERLLRAHRTVWRRDARALGAVVRRLGPAARSILGARGAKLELVSAKLDGRDPAAVLERGYAIVTLDGRIVRDASSAPPGAVVEARLARGTLVARVESGGRDDGE